MKEVLWIAFVAILAVVLTSNSPKTAEYMEESDWATQKEIHQKEIEEALVAHAQFMGTALSEAAK